MPDLSDAEIAYAAGFFDGEGHIAIMFKSQSQKARRKSAYARYRLMCQASQVRPEVLVWLQGRFGGSLRHGTYRRSYDDAEYGRWDWTVNTAAALAFLRIIRPYIIVKAEEADIALRFGETIDRNGGRKPLPPEVIDLRARLFSEIREVRKRRTAQCPQSANASTG